MVANKGATGDQGIIEAQKTGTPIKFSKWRWDDGKWQARRIIGSDAASLGATSGGTSSGASSEVQSKPNNPLSMFSQVFDNMLKGITGEKTSLDWGNTPTGATSGTTSGGSLTGNTQASNLPVGKPKEFAAFLAPMAQKLYKSHNILPSITIAQAAEETGWGKYAIGNNIFGVKAFSDWKGKKINARTHEFYGGTKSSEDAWFRDYDSIEDCMNDRGKVLSNSRYDAVRNATNYADAARALYTGGYATNPSYPTNLISIIKSNNLSQYDTKGNGFGFGLNIPKDSQADAGANGMVNSDISSTNASRATSIARQVISSANINSGSGSATTLLATAVQILANIAGYNSIIADNTGNLSAQASNLYNSNMTNVNNAPTIITNNNGSNVYNSQTATEINSQRQKAEMIAKGIF